MEMHLDQGETIFYKYLESIYCADIEFLMSLLEINLA